MKTVIYIVELNPPPTEQICQQFNELRSDIVLHYELRSALSTCDYELQSLRHQYEALAPGKVIIETWNKCFMQFEFFVTLVLSSFISDFNNTTGASTKNRTGSQSGNHRRGRITHYAQYYSLIQNNLHVR